MSDSVFQLHFNRRRIAPVDFDGRLAAALELQLMRIDGTARETEVLNRFSEAIAKALERSLDADLRAPSQAQLRQLLSIAQDLNVALPASVLRFRGEADAFLLGPTSGWDDEIESRGQR